MLYFFNRAEWGGDVFPLLVLAGCWPLVMMFLAAAFPLLGRRRLLCANTLLIFGLIILANDVFSPVQLGILDGQRLSSDEPLLSTMVELVILVAVSGLFIYFSSADSNWPEIFSFAVLFAGAVLVLLSVVTASADHPSRDQAANATVSDQPNIYHLHLDAMQTDFFLHYLNTEDSEQNFDGFVLYENNIANYAYTLPSVASYLTGTVYTEGRYDHWLDGASSG
ncbi:MAG: hypothetical protein DRR06_08960, partial [Gammaproteobacteria bacterium]